MTTISNNDQIDENVMNNVASMNDFLDSTNNTLDSQMLCASPKDVFKQDLENFSKSLLSAEQSLECHICKMSNLSEEDLREHLKMHKQKYKCSYCDLDCSSSDDLTSHLRLHKISE